MGCYYFVTRLYIIWIDPKATISTTYNFSFFFLFVFFEVTQHHSCWEVCCSKNDPEYGQQIARRLYMLALLAMQLFCAASGFCLNCHLWGRSGNSKVQNVTFSLGLSYYICVIRDYIAGHADGHRKLMSRAWLNRKRRYDFIFRHRLPVSVEFWDWLSCAMWTWGLTGKTRLRCVLWNVSFHCMVPDSVDFPSNIDIL